MNDSPHPKLLSRPELLRRRETWRRSGRRIAFTNGCFDLLHRGHVESLEMAAQHGEMLIVGLNDDDSVRRLKGAGRPLQSVEDRIIVLGALTCISWITVFGETSVEPLIRALLPDCLVKGGDYSPDQIVGAEAVEAAGGQVVVTPHVQHASTSDLLRRLERS
ncbi:MAG: adenylyltransferase/cytidyltransferase family protein [Gemmatimonadetes bacterium]|jgi:rfaE bifunctional protein nucleotidyltransferase chain/domain|nr:adenylyltransferase/cytidyltransferase family protein [Gemmatimonadota bacterium]MBT7861812.1 adenylyltransferase/cytidyltransferase family protein [Gemmatimonadota bacterium]